MAIRITPSARLNGIRYWKTGSHFSERCGQKKRHELIEKYKECRRKNQVQRQHPAGNFFGLVSIARLQRRIGGKPKRLDAQRRGLPECRHASQNREAEHRVPVRYFRQHTLFGDDRAVRPPHSDAIAVGGAHHDAFENRLAADEGLFLAAFSRRQHQRMRAKAQELLERQAGLTPPFSIPACPSGPCRGQPEARRGAGEERRLSADSRIHST